MQDNPVESQKAYLNTDPKEGLTSVEVKKRLEVVGDNAISEKRIGVVQRFLNFFWGPIPWMIEVAALLSAVGQRWEDFIIISIMLLLNAFVGFWQEFKADNAIQALKQKLALTARVLRDGQWRSIPAKKLVPGDIVVVKLGNIIPADIKLISGEYLSVDQSALTGESLPVEKKVGDEIYASSIARLGEMIGIVTGTGMNTFFGQTAKLVETAETKSHFQKAVLKIGNYLIVITLILVCIILTVTLLRHDPLIDTILFALILTIAAIPVALPAVLSVTMAVGALRLAKMKAIVSKLVSIEELAGIDILCSDKTGTLTQNQLTIGEPILFEGNKDDLMVSAALASESQSDDVIDQTILKSLPANINLKEYEVKKFTPFDSTQKRTDAMIQCNNASFEVTKGAPQIILGLIQNPTLQKQVESKVDELGAQGYRTLGIASKKTDQDWKFLGLIPLFDPPREDSAETIKEADNMGLEVKMLTGDHTAIAKEIARKLNLGDNIVSAQTIFKGKEMNVENLEQYDGFSEVFPEHKFKIVKAFQAKNHIIGMTGDGVNDAPALKQADIGIAVSGATDAARSAAALVLTDPGLSVIIRAVEEARKIFERMNSYATFRITETIRVLLFISVSILAFNFYPVTAIMIVLLAILNDFPIMMIAYDNAPVALCPVRWNMKRVLTLSTAIGILGVMSTFILFYVVLEILKLPKEMIQSLIFLKLLVSGHFTLYVTRNMGALWQRPWPNWRLVVVIESTQLMGTLAVIYGFLLSPIGWIGALFIWGWAIVEVCFASILKILIVRCVNFNK